MKEYRDSAVFSDNLEGIRVSAASKTFSIPSIVSLALFFQANGHITFKGILHIKI